mmetsp:Transcript_20267/g.29754  ORF Transcript_20267/g.29754 Transcript_20267/m.29754 type:complete len:204 (+) Transcript_20267:1667-2278(+)
MRLTTSRHANTSTRAVSFLARRSLNQALWALSAMSSALFLTRPSRMAGARTRRPRRRPSARCTTSRTTSTTACHWDGLSSWASSTPRLAKPPSTWRTLNLSRRSAVKFGARMARSCPMGRRRPRRQTRCLRLLWSSPVMVWSRPLKSVWCGRVSSLRSTFPTRSSSWYIRVRRTCSTPRAHLSGRRQNGFLRTSPLTLQTACT